MILGNVTFDFSHIGPNEIVICIVGYLVVFSALVLMYFVFYNLPKILKIKLKIKKRSKEIIAENEICASGEVNAAIGLALYTYFNELHDEESNVITIKKISKFYSPWSSKIYGLRGNLHR